MNKTLTLALLTLALTGLAAAQGPSTNINISVIETEPVPLQTSEYADIWFSVENTGSTTAEGVEVSFLDTFPFETDPDERTSWTIGTLPEGQERQYHLQVRVDPNAVHGENDLRFQYSTDSGVSLTRDVPIQVQTDDAPLVIDDLTVPETVAPGEDAEMEMSLANLANVRLKNIDVSLDLSDTPLATRDTTRKRIPELNADGTATASFTLSSDSSTSTGLYTVPITIEYENEAGTTFSVTQETGIRIGGEPRLEVGINENEIQQAGQTGSITLRIVNRGDGNADYVNMEIPEGEGYEILSQSSVYLGNMDPDDYQTAEFEIHAGQDLDTLELPVELSYRAVGSDMTTEEQTVSSKLYSSSELQRYQPSGSGNTALIGLVLLIVIGAGIIYWRRRG